MSLPRADLETLLRARQLDRTLTTALPPVDPRDEYAIGPTGVTRLDEMLEGGFPRGQLSEIVGARSSGRTSVLLHILAAATARGELVALVDALDMLDVESAAAAGIDLSRLLWIRGYVVSQPGLCRDSNQRALEQAVRALALVLSAGNFGLVAFDVGEAPPRILRQLPFTTWLRLHRMVEGSQTVCVLLGDEPMARSSAGLTMQLGLETPVSPETDAKHPRNEALGLLRHYRKDGNARAGQAGRAGQVSRAGLRFEGRLFTGLDIRARVIRARARVHENVCVSLSTSCA